MSCTRQTRDAMCNVGIIIEPKEKESGPNMVQPLHNTQTEATDHSYQQQHYLTEKLPTRT